MHLLSAHEIAIEVMSQMGDHGQKNLHPVIRLVSRAMKQLNLKYNPQIKAEMFEMSDALTITLPEGAVRPIKTGVLNRNMVRLDLFELRGDTFSEAMIEGCVCDNEKELNVTTCPVHTLHGCCFGGMVYGTMGWKGQNQYIGSAVWKPQNNTIYYNSHGLETGSYVIVEYEMSGNEQAYMVPEILQEAIIQRVLQWFHQEKRPQVSQYHHQQFRIELNEAKKLAETGTYDDYIRALRGVYSPAIMVASSTPPPRFVTQAELAPVNPVTGIPGPYTDDVEAATAGVPIGGQYYLDGDNPYGMPKGMIKIVSEQVLANTGTLVWADNDADAATKGVLLGGYYALKDSNTYGLPKGMVKKRIE